MTLNELIRNLGTADTYDFYQWICFLSNKPPCKMCINTCVEKGYIPHCNKCIPSKKLINQAKKLLEEKEMNKHAKKTSEK